MEISQITYSTLLLKQGDLDIGIPIVTSAKYRLYFIYISCAFLIVFNY